MAIIDILKDYPHAERQEERLCKQDNIKKAVFKKIAYMTGFVYQIWFYTDKTHYMPINLSKEAMEFFKNGREVDLRTVKIIRFQTPQKEFVRAFGKPKKRSNLIKYLEEAEDVVCPGDNA